MPYYKLNHNEGSYIILHNNDETQTCHLLVHIFEEKKGKKKMRENRIINRRN